MKIKLKKEEEKVIKVWEDENIKIEKARWGRFKIIYEKGFVELSKDSEPTKLSLEESKRLLVIINQVNRRKKISNEFGIFRTCLCGGFGDY